jgi:3-phosphoshikimate 1-carboxyvinyltransferase
MIVSIQPSGISGPLQAPASKSSMQRACAAALLHKGQTILHNPGHSHDDLAALDTIQKLGATVSFVDHQEAGLSVKQLHIQSQGVKPVSSEINCGESGLGVRMFTPIAALSSDPLVINGKGSLLTRPLHFFDVIFPQLGISITSSQGHLPLHIHGPLKPASITVDGSLSSQFLTGLLMAFAAAGATNQVITVKDLKSKPYIDLTLKVLDAFGWKVTHNHYETFHFSGAASAHATGASLAAGSLEYRVEGDWSGAAFLLVAGAIAGQVEVRGLDIGSVQADKAILSALRDSGASLTIDAEKIVVGPASVVAAASVAAPASVALKPFVFDATDCPDLFPPLVALASYANGVTEIKGVSRLAHKESDRGTTLKEEFAKLGIEVDLDGDLMRVHGGTGVKSAKVHSRNDHRIAMACAVAALRAEGPVVIEEAQAVNKSYTDFYDDLSTWGVPVQVL